MKTYLECYPCIINQTLQAAKQNQLSEPVRKTILNNVLQFLQDLPADMSPPSINRRIQAMIRESTGLEDPYEKWKLHSNVEAMEVISEIRRRIREARDPFEAAVRYAIAGTVYDIEFAEAGGEIHREIEYAPQAKFGINHLKELRRDLRSARSVLYLADNAGEIAFDKLLVEVLREMITGEIVFAVRDTPSLNNATLEDAEHVGLDSLVHLVSFSSDAPVIILEDIDPRMKHFVDQADLIIAKGQTHYESLNESPLNIYFLFKVTCGVVSRDLDAEMHQYVVAHTKPEKKND